MPFDTGRLYDPAPEPAGRADVQEPMPSVTTTVGQRLRAAREAQGLTLERVAEATKVRESLLQALEEMRLADLPSRPFAIGYVRAYAEAVGLDPDAISARFRRETPELDVSLKSPLGLSIERRSRLPMILGGVGAVAAAIVVWNVGQRLLFSAPAQAPVAQADPGRALAELPAPSGVIRIGAPTPAPAEQTVPAPYVTPGLEAAYAAAYGLAPPAEPAPGQPTPPPPAPDLSLTPAAFTPQGEVFGAPTQRASVVLQAVKPGNLIVRDAAGNIFFARQLSPGQAYRAPAVEGLVVEVSDTAAFAVYRDGRLSAALTQTAVSLDKLAQASATG